MVSRPSHCDLGRQAVGTATCPEKSEIGPTSESQDHDSKSRLLALTSRSSRVLRACRSVLVAWVLPAAGAPIRH